MVRIIGTLGKYDQRRLWKLICIVNLLVFYFKKSQKSNLSLDYKNLKWEEISLWNKCFSQIHVGYNYTLLFNILYSIFIFLFSHFYSIVFETLICQLNSSECSPIIPDEVREHLTRDQRPFLHPESIQTRQINIFSSVHLTHLLQGSDQRTPDKRSETIPSSRITPDPLNDQLHDGASSLQFTHLLQGSGQTGLASRSLVLCSVTHFCIVF